MNWSFYKDSTFDNDALDDPCKSRTESRTESKLKRPEDLHTEGAGLGLGAHWFSHQLSHAVRLVASLHRVVPIRGGPVLHRPAFFGGCLRHLLTRLVVDLRLSHISNRCNLNIMITHATDFNFNFFLLMV